LKKDVISKDIIKELLIDISKYFLNLEIKTDNIKFLDKEFQIIEKREADIVANINDEYILHLEIQNNNDSFMLNRMLRYYNEILMSTKDLNLPIKQYLIYIGKEKPKFELKLKRDKITYEYNFLDIKTIDCDILLKQDSPKALVLAILCDFKEKQPKEVVSYIIDKLEQRLKDNIYEFKKYMLMLETLSSNRNLESVVEEVKMLRTTTYQDLPSWRIGLKEGIEQGIERGIEQGIEQGKNEALKKAINGFLKLNKTPEEIAILLEEDKELIFKLVNYIKKEK